MEKVRYGVIGIGNMGSQHVRQLAENMIENAELTAVCDINPKRLDWVKDNFGEDIVLFDDYKKLLTSGLIDAVIIATPHYLHPVIGIEAFEAGLHVLSEKPIGVYTNKVVEMMEVAKKSGKAFGIMYNQRTNPIFQKAREFVQGGELGTLKRCVWIITDWYRTQQYYNSGTWRATWEGEGGGVLLNQCPHNLDLWQWIFGMPKKIRAFMSFGKYHDIEVEDDVTAYAEYENGATGVFITTTGETPGTNRLEISGSRGKLICENGKLIFHRSQKDEREYCYGSKDGFAKPMTDVFEVKFEERKKQEHLLIIENFTNHIIKGTPLLAPGYEGINGLSISNAMHLSAWKNETIDMPGNGDEFYALLQERIKLSNVKKAEATGEVANLSGTYNN
ncbi:MAG: Gfo/Idh/MocA family oxidoreductase [Clostridia bacterium]|nr:Gfo/Idh/MocA family oxidoreductase [Clostridia bacterium]